MFDIRGIVFCQASLNSARPAGDKRRLHVPLGCNEVDQTFYESIIYCSVIKGYP